MSYVQALCKEKKNKLPAEVGESKYVTNTHVIRADTGAQQDTRSRRTLRPVWLSKSLIFSFDFLARFINHMDTTSVDKTHSASYSEMFPIICLFRSCDMSAQLMITCYCFMLSL